MLNATAKVVDIYIYIYEHASSVIYDGKKANLQNAVCVSTKEVNNGSSAANHDRSLQRNEKQSIPGGSDILPIKLLSPTQHTNTIKTFKSYWCNRKNDPTVLFISHRKTDSNESWK